MRFPTLLLALSIFFTGATGLVNEYVLSTVSTYILGNSIEQFSITIAVMLLFMGIGGFMQKYVGDKYLIEMFIGIEILLTLLGSFAPILIYAAFGYMESHFMIIMYFLIASIGFLVGFEIPFVTRINKTYTDTLKTNLAVIVSADYVGAFIGAIVWVKLLLPHVHLFKVGFLISALNFTMALITFFYFRASLRFRSFFFYIPLFLLVSGGLFYGYTHAEKYEVTLEQKLYDDRVVFTKTTKYQHITVTYNPLINEHRLYLNGNLQFSTLDEKRYHEFLVHPAFALSIESPRVLILGGGDGLALREVKKYSPKEVYLIDIDPEMVKLASTDSLFRTWNKEAFSGANITLAHNYVNQGESKSLFQREKGKNTDQSDQFVAELHVVHIDADRFLRDVEKKHFDVIIIDLPDPNSIELAKLYSKEFYRRLYGLLSPNGVIAIQASSSYFAKEVYLGIGRTMRSAGLFTVAYHHNIPSFGEWGFYLASKTPLIKESVQNITLSTQTEYITTDLFLSSLHFGKNDLTTHKTFINTRMNPRLYYEYAKNSWLNY